MQGWRELEMTPKLKHVSPWPCCDWKPLLYFPQEYQQRPNNCMYEYWCLTRCPFRFTSSLHFLQVKFCSPIKSHCNSKIGFWYCFARFKEFLHCFCKDQRGYKDIKIVYISIFSRIRSKGGGSSNLIFFPNSK